MSWKTGLIVLLVLFVLACVASCWVEAYFRRRDRAAWRKYDSKFFRNVTDAHYRVGNMAGLGG